MYVRYKIYVYIYITIYYICMIWYIWNVFEMYLKCYTVGGCILHKAFECSPRNGTTGNKRQRHRHKSHLGTCGMSRDKMFDTNMICLIMSRHVEIWFQLSKKTSSFCLTHTTLKFDTKPSLPWIVWISHLAMLRKCPMTAGDKALDGVHLAWSCTLLQFHWMGGTTWRHWIQFEYVCIGHVWVSFPWNLIEPTFTYLNLTVVYSFLPNNSEMGSAQQKKCQKQIPEANRRLWHCSSVPPVSVHCEAGLTTGETQKLMMITDTRYQYLGNVISPRISGT